MPQQSFFIQLALVSAGTAGLLLWINTFPQFSPHSSLNWSSLILFILLSLMMYFVGRKAALSENKNTFTNTVLLFTMAKLFLTIIIIYVYNEMVKPESRLFILPFFAIYIIFTIFETYFMIRLGKMKA